MDRKTINLDSIDAYNRLYGIPTLHPLVTVVNLKDIVSPVNNIRFRYGVYALFLKNGAQCSIRYGRQHYDYHEGTVVSFSPGQVVDVEIKPADIVHDVTGLLFHPDLIYGTPLAEKIRSFSFFDYSSMEALHLSEDERRKFLDCLGKIEEEISHPVDHHSATLISANIQLLLEYLHRFYDRQFMTRHKVNSSVVEGFQCHLREWSESPDAFKGIPSVAYFADKAALSPGYFGDLIRKETGTSPKELIALHVVGEAKHRLSVTDADVSEIAYELGFEYPAHFSRMFKRITGQTPSEYRASLS